MDALVSGVVSAVISGLLVAYFKFSMEANAKVREQNQDLRFKSVQNDIASVELTVKSVKTDVKAELNGVRGQLLNITKAIHEVDKKTEVLVEKQRGMSERLSDFGQVIRRD